MYVHNICMYIVYMSYTQKYINLFCVSFYSANGFSKGNPLKSTEKILHAEPCIPKSLFLSRILNMKHDTFNRS